MSQFRITGRIPLSGTVRISGRKNAALKLIAATLLTDSDSVLRRVPAIGDVATMFRILESMGASVSDEGGGTYRVNTSAVSDPTIPEDLGRKLRASLILVGPLLARFGRAVFPHPGGCVIGKRSIAPHLLAFERLGAKIEFDGTTYTITSERLTGDTVYLKERSVTGTENLIMASVRAAGTTRIMNAAEEQHIVNLCDYLRTLGYQVSGDGTSHVVVNGSDSLSSVPGEATIIPDEIEIGTFACAALVTGGTVTLQGVGSPEGLLPITSKLDDFNAKYEFGDDSITLLPSNDLRAANVQTNPWPGFPPDLQSPFTVLATQAKGTSLIHDWMYEGRLYFTDLLTKMGAEITICDPHRALVTGPTPLTHSSLITPDLRAGAAFVIAALAAEGTSIVEHVELIDRGYDKIEERLSALGASIVRE